MPSKITPLLLTWEEYNKKEILFPYIFQIKNKKQLLLYFGASHTHNSQDDQFDNIKKYWQDFLKNTKNKQCLVLIEGGQRKIYKNSNKAILNDGEAGYITYLSAQSNIEINSPEPPDNFVINKLLKKFSKNKIYYNYFANLILQWHRLDPVPNLEKYLGNYFYQDKHEFNWKDFEFSLDHMKKIHQDLFNKKFNPLDEDFFYNITTPTENTCTINKVSQERGLIRDVYIVEQIIKYWKEGKNLFIVFGFSHAIVQEPALIKLLK